MSAKFEVHTFGSLYLSGNTIEIRDTKEREEITWIRVPEMGIFVADRVILTDVSWNDLDKAGFVSGKTIRIDGKSYRCRLPKVGNDIHSASEWNCIVSILGKYAYLLGVWDNPGFWGLEADEASDARVVCCVAGRKHFDLNYRDRYVGFRPILDPIPEKESGDSRSVSVQEALTMLEIMATNLTGEAAGMPEKQAEQMFRRMDALDMAIESLRRWESKDKEEWISMDERKPEEGERVIFWLGKLNVYGDPRLKLTLDAIWNEHFQPWLSTATHWMKAPEPPKE